MMKYFTPENFLDCAIYALWLAYIIVCYAHDLRGTWINQYGWMYERDKFIVQFLKENLPDGADEESLMVACMIFIWIKAFLSIRFNAYLGPMYGVVFRMGKDLISYCVMLVSFLMLMSLIGTLLFRDLEGFNSLQSSVVTLIQGGWGTYDYQEMQYSQYSSIVGYAFIIVFAVLIVIIINNFLVAILANTYS